MLYGNRISFLREKAGLTQEELSKKIGITRAALSHYEKNRREPDLKTLQKLADFFEVSLDYITGRTDDPNPTNETNDELTEEIAELERIANDEKIILTAYGKKLDPEDEILARQLLRTIVERARVKHKQKNG